MFAFSAFRNRRGPPRVRLTRASSSSKSNILPTHGEAKRHPHNDNGVWARFTGVLPRPSLRFRLSDEAADTHLNRSWMTAVRPLLVVILTGFGFLWLWWSWNSTGTAATKTVDEYLTRHDEHFLRPLSSPTALPTKNTSTSTPSPSAPLRYANFSKLLFPEHGTDGTARPWVGANHRTLRTLFECIELGSCGENQEKGESLPWSSDDSIC